MKKISNRKGGFDMEESRGYQELLEEEILIQQERDEREEELWAHDPDTGERTFYLGCMI